MIQIWLWLIGFILLRNVILRKYKYNTLGCGLVGFCGSRPADPMIIRWLMLYNLERGEDATGWVINNKITKDSEKAPKFLTENKLEINKDHENYTIIAHVRKASVGGKWAKNLAHPFGKYSDGVEKENYDIVLAMNGTMFNLDEYAKHFKTTFNRANSSDTELLSAVMARLGDDYREAIEGIDGAATLLFFNPNRPNSLMVYKDSGRPLYMWQKSKNEIYTSSMQESFLSCGAAEKDVFKFEDDCLYTLERGVIRQKEKIVRKPIKEPIKNFQSGSSYQRYGHNYYQQTNYEVMRAVKNKTIDDTYAHKKNGNGLYVHIDKYYRNGHPVDGAFWVNANGKVNTSPSDETIKVAGFQRYFFVNGYMLKDEESYNALTKMTSGIEGNLNKEIFKKTRLSSFCKYFKYPVYAYAGKQRILVYDGDIKEKENIRIEMFLDDLIYTIQYDEAKTGETKVPIYKLVSSIAKSKKSTDSELEKYAYLSTKEKELAKNPNFQFLLSPLIEALVKEHSFTKSMDKIVEYIKENPKDDLSRIFIRVSLDFWKVNDSKEYYKLYIYLLIKLADQKNIISATFKDSYIEDIKKMNFYDNIVDTKNNTNFNMIKTNILNLHKNILIDSQTNIGQKSFSEIITENRETNEYFCNQTLRNAVHNASFKDLTEIELEYAVTTQLFDDNSRREFYEAILYFMHFINRIDDKEIISKINLSIDKLQTYTAEQYLSYKEFITDTGKVIEEEITEDVEDNIEEDEYTIQEDFFNLVEEARAIRLKLDEKGNDVSLIEKKISEVIDTILQSNDLEIELLGTQTT